MSRCEQFLKPAWSFEKNEVSGSVCFVQSLGLGLFRTESRARFVSYRVSGSVCFVQSLGLGLFRTESRARFVSYRVSGSVCFVQSLGLGLFRTESRARFVSYRVSGSDFVKTFKSRSRIFKQGSRRLGKSRILQFATPNETFTVVGSCNCFD